MKSLKELSEERKLKREKKSDQDALLETLKHSVKSSTGIAVDALMEIQSNWAMMSSQQQAETMMLVTEIVKNIPKPDMSINFNGMEHINVKSVNVEGLKEELSSLTESLVNKMEKSNKAHMDMMESYHKTMTAQLKEIVQAVSSISITLPEIRVPEIKIPEIKVPQPKVTVQVPPPTIIDNTKAEEREEEPISVETKKDRFGKIAEIVETYKSGKVVTSYKDGVWTTDDRRKKTT